MNQPNSLQRILQEGVIKVGTRYGQTTYQHGAGGAQGFDYELITGFAAYLRVKVEIAPRYTLEELLSALAKQDIDIIATEVSVTHQQTSAFRFGPSYQDISQRLVLLQGSPQPAALTDLAGNLVVEADSLSAEMLHSQIPQHSALHLQQTTEQDSEELLAMVSKGLIDYTVVGSNILPMIQQRFANLTVGLSLTGRQPIAWLLYPAEDDSLLAALVEYFGIIHNDGTFAALHDKYFSQAHLFNHVDTREFIKLVRTTLPKYQSWFESYADDIDWRLLAAMSFQESRWNVTSASNMMMLDPNMAKHLAGTSPMGPEQSIRIGAHHFTELMRQIPDRIATQDKIWLTMAAYHIGLGHLQDARILTQKQGGNPDLWIDVKQRLPLLQNKKTYKTTRYGYARGSEAVTYVDNVRRYYDTLVWLDENPVETNN